MSKGGGDKKEREGETEAGRKREATNPKGGAW